MSELRQDRTTGRWVIIAPQRKSRPHAAARHAPIKASRPCPFDPTCPFCPGNEAQLPAILTEMATDAPPHWSVRVVPNKYPALQPDAGHNAYPTQPRLRKGFGFHEVLVENPRHDADLVTMIDAEIEAVVAGYRDRSRYLLARPGIEAAILFRNHGPRGGASLQHPHSQIIAVGDMPPAIAVLVNHGRAYHRDHGRCATCDEIAGEREAGVRIVEETPQFVALVPFAAACISEIWIVPKRHQASFADIAESDVSDFARLLRRTLARLRRTHNDPPYNFVIDSADRDNRGAAHVHWRLRIIPSLTIWGGFEHGAGMPINPSLPEDDAALLRQAGGEEPM